MDIYCLTDEAFFSRMSPQDQVSAFMCGGAKIIQFRAKKMSDREFLSCAKKIRVMTRKAGCLFIVNDRLDIACRVFADGVHLGQDDMKILDAKRCIEHFFAQKNHVDVKMCKNSTIFPKIFIQKSFFYIGHSTHSLSQAILAEHEGADYIGIGPVFPTQTKPDSAPIGISVVREVRKKVKIPIVAIGGITEKNVQDVLATGVRIIAMVTGITRAESIEEAVRKAIHFY
ncbi:thiamine phosphate synthase [Candidatus Peregrinibacteria bacterium]|nr:thiamine phosphate synthase [Candidatus Peregrinibacteria bacterium]